MNDFYKPQIARVPIGLATEDGECFVLRDGGEPAFLGPDARWGEDLHIFSDPAKAKEALDRSEWRAAMDQSSAA